MIIKNSDGRSDATEGSPIGREDKRQQSNDGGDRDGDNSTDEEEEDEHLEHAIIAEIYENTNSTESLDTGLDAPSASVSELSLVRQHSSQETQTDPGFNATEFDWDLSDKIDAEVQTVFQDQTQCPPVRDVSDAIVQTDQRFLPLVRMQSPGGTTSYTSVTYTVHLRKETRDQFCQTSADDFQKECGVQTEPEYVTVAYSGGLYPRAKSLSAHSALLRFEDSPVPSRIRYYPSISVVTSPSRSPSSIVRDAECQTENDLLTDEAPRFAAKPPPCRKLEFLQSAYASERPLPSLSSVEKSAYSTPLEATADIASLAAYLSEQCEHDDLLLVQAYFIWIAVNFTFDWKYTDVPVSAQEALSRRAGICRDFTSVFTALCEAGGIRVKQLHGYARGRSAFPPACCTRPTSHSPPTPPDDNTENGPNHTWNAVFLRGAWWLLDCTYGAGYMDNAGQFQRRFDEHYFLTDPDEFIWTHFPYDAVEKNYDRWQLLHDPWTLEAFNSVPLVTSKFFLHELKLKRGITCPFEVVEQAEILITAVQPMRYKYKLYSIHAAESILLNRYVFCHLKEERMSGSFLIAPPEEGKYFLKIYAKPEQGLEDDNALDHVATFLIDCTKQRRYFQAWPSHDLPWGLTQDFYATGAKLTNQFSPIIVLWGGKRQLVFRKTVDLLTTFHLYDADGNKVDSKGIVVKEDTDTELRIAIVSPQKLGLFKLLLYGIRKPKAKGRWRVPLIAAFLIDNKVRRTSASARKRGYKRYNIN